VKPRRPRQLRPPRRPGVIDADCIYAGGEFRARMRVGRNTLTAWRRAGLPAHTLAGKVFIDGREAVEFFRGQWKQEGIPAEVAGD
jgi:hypothetical protein